jgi:hypothetical protein
VKRVGHTHRDRCKRLPLSLRADIVDWNFSVIDFSVDRFVFWREFFLFHFIIYFDIIIFK